MTANFEAKLNEKREKDREMKQLTTEGEQASRPEASPETRPETIGEVTKLQEESQIQGAN